MQIMCVKFDPIANLELAQGTIMDQYLDNQEALYFDTRDLQYLGYCDDFGPMNASTILEFVALLDALIIKHPDKRLVYCAQPGRRSLTNAAFLLGSYLILALGQDPDAVWTFFGAVPQGTFEHYRDATLSAPRFDLTLLDCWRALANGKSLGWIDRLLQGRVRTLLLRPLLALLHGA